MISWFKSYGVSTWIVWILIVFVFMIVAAVTFFTLAPSTYDAQSVAITTQGSPGAVRAVLVDKYASTSCGSLTRPKDVFNYFCMDFEYTVGGITRVVSYTAQKDEFNSHKIGDIVWIRFK